MKSDKDIKKPIVIFPEYQRESKKTPFQEKAARRQRAAIGLIERKLKIVTPEKIHTPEEILLRISKGEFGLLYEPKEAKWTEFGSQIYQLCKKIVYENKEDENTREIALRIMRTLTDLGNEVIL